MFAPQGADRCPKAYLILSVGFFYGYQLISRTKLDSKT